MKTKEITVWVQENFLNNGSHLFYCSKEDKVAGFILKAKLIIELPERKVTITESEFDDICSEFDLMNPCFKTFSGAMEHIKQKLFSKADM